MDATYFDATEILPDHGKHRPVIVMPGHGRQYAIGDIAYRVIRPQIATKFASLFPVMFVDSEWRGVYNTPKLTKIWSDPCTLIERL